MTTLTEVVRLRAELSAAPFLQKADAAEALSDAIIVHFHNIERRLVALEKQAND